VEANIIEYLKTKFQGEEKKPEEVQVEGLIFDYLKDKFQKKKNDVPQEPEEIQIEARILDYLKEKFLPNKEVELEQNEVQQEGNVSGDSITKKFQQQVTIESSEDQPIVVPQTALVPMEDIQPSESYMQMLIRYYCEAKNTAEAAIDTQTAAFIRSSLVKNRVSIFADRQAIAPTIGGFFVTGDILLMPHHYFLATGLNKFYIQSNVAHEKEFFYEVELKEGNHLIDETKDCVFVRVDGLHFFRDITKHFITEDKYRTTKSIIFSASACTQFGKQLPGILNCTQLKYIDKDIAYTLPNQEKPIRIVTGWQ